MVIGWLIIEKGIIRCFPKHRRKNNFCEKLGDGKKHNIGLLFEKAYGIAENHHSILSLYHYDQRKTIEFRVCEGTNNSETIENWIKFCYLFLNYCKNMDVIEVLKKDIGNKNIFFAIEELKLTGKIKKWLEGRYELFNKED